MKLEFPRMYQAAMNLTNGSPEAKHVIETWRESNGGSVEHKSFEQVKAEVIPLLRTKESA